jgi:hypothetical protein
VHRLFSWLFCLIVRVHKVSTRSLWRGAAPEARPPCQRNPLLVLTRATVAFAFYPRHPLDGSRCRQPAAWEDVSSQRASRPDRRTDLPPSCFFMCPSPPCLSRTLALSAIHAAERKERHGVGKALLRGPVLPLAGVCRVPPCVIVFKSVNRK